MALVVILLKIFLKFSVVLPLLLSQLILRHFTFSRLTLVAPNQAVVAPKHEPVLSPLIPTLSLLCA